MISKKQSKGGKNMVIIKNKGNDCINVILYIPNVMYIPVYV